MSVFDDLLRLTRQLHVASDQALQPLRWRPAADIYRVPRGWLIKIELAGVRAEQIELNVSGRFLSVRGRRTDTEYVEGAECHSLEISYSQFQRSFEFPNNLEQAQIITEYRNGMLLVRIVTEA
jgi:HSP20 family protein